MLAKIRIDMIGTIHFYDENNRHHRLDGGPAIELYDGSKQWLVNGKTHRLDGPAIEWHDGRKGWFINDKDYSEEEFNEIVGGLC